MDDDNPNETNIYLTQQLNKFGLAYIHFIEPRVGGNMDCEVRHDSFDTQHFRKVWKGTFISAGEAFEPCVFMWCSTWQTWCSCKRKGNASKYSPTGSIQDLLRETHYCEHRTMLFCLC